jgi:hypothetical protein
VLDSRLCSIPPAVTQGVAIQKKKKKKEKTNNQLKKLNRLKKND